MRKPLYIKGVVTPANIKVCRCTVCNEVVGAQDFEPRFGYYICKAHENVPPAKLDQARQDWKNRGL